MRVVLANVTANSVSFLSCVSHSVRILMRMPSNTVLLESSAFREMQLLAAPHLNSSKPGIMLEGTVVRNVLRVMRLLSGPVNCTWIPKVHQKTF